MLYEKVLEGYVPLSSAALSSLMLVVLLDAVCCLSLWSDSDN
jgi:hypothetical protein